MTDSRSVNPEISKMGIRDMLQTLTRGRPYIFVIMAYTSRWPLYERIKETAGREFNVACIRADELKSSGHDLLSKIHFLISRAELVIAEISERKENVFYEIGYAVGIQKSPILLVEKECERDIPADLQGLEVIRYRLDKDGTRALDAELAEHLRLRLNTELALLRDMLEAPIPQPVYILSAPKYPGKHSRIAGQLYDSRTFGDQLGILGLLSVFGRLREGVGGIELVSAQHGSPDLMARPLSLCLIGSEKVNPFSGGMLDLLQAGRDPKWQFGPRPGYTRADADWPVGLFRTVDGRQQEIQGKTKKRGSKKEEVWIEDYGVVVRGPHPDHPGRLVLIMAGAHSLGTGAACLAATQCTLIRQIRDKLPERVMEDKESTFWALVKGRASDKDGMLDVEGVTVEDAGVYASGGTGQPGIGPRRNTTGRTATKRMQGK